MNTDNLVEFRKDLGLTQTEMGKIIGVQKTTYACYENKNRIIPILKLNIISNKYNKSLNFLSGNSRSDNISFTKKEISLSDISIVLKRERKNNNLTQEQLSKKLNVDRTTISLYEHNKGITIPVLIQYSELFDKTIDYLCGKADK